MTPGRVEGALEAFAHLALDGEVLAGHALRDRADRHRRPGDRLDAEHLGLVDELLAPDGVGGHRGHGLADHRDDPLDVLGVGDRHVDERRGEALRPVADPDDLAVADVPGDAVRVAQPGDPQGHLLDRADGLTGVDDVADAVLVLEDHEDPGEEVLDQALGAEAERDAGDAGRREQRPERDADAAP